MNKNTGFIVLVICLFFTSLYAAAPSRELLSRYNTLKAPKWPDIRDDINAADYEGSTALMYACNKGDVKLVRMLIEEGADVNIKNYYRMTALMYAAEKGNTEVVKLLLNVMYIDVNAKDRNGWTALMMAINSGSKGTVKAILDKNADINAKNNNDVTALMMAVQKDTDNDYGLVEIFLEKEGININIEDSQGHSALDYAYFYGNIDAVKLLKNAGAE